MKKLLLIALSIATLLIFISCSSVDINLTNKDNIYGDLAELINNHDAHIDKSVKLRAITTAVYNFSQNKIDRHTIVESKPDGTGRALYEIRTADGIYPTIGTEATVIGKINKDKYIEVSEFSDAIFDSETTDIDALSMSSEELEDFISVFCSEYNQSEHYEKSIRIFGHLVGQNDYYYLLGLDKNGAFTWSIELHTESDDVEFITANGNTINPVEIIGRLSIYFENNIAYACISVSRVTPIEGSLS